MTLICIVGIDGSGKTTLAKAVVKELQERGIDATYRWCRFESKVLALALRVYNGIAHRKGAPRYRTNQRRKSKLLRNPFLRKAYMAFVRWSYARQIRREIGRPLKEGKVVVADRYVHDSVVDFAVDMDFDERQLLHSLSNFSSRAPHPDLVIHVDLPPETAMARKDDVPELSYLSSRARHYALLAERRSWPQVDGSRPPGEVRASAMAVLTECVEVP